MKKRIVSILAAAMLILPTFETFSYADSAPIQLDSGKLQNNRVLIPLRAVSENLGADVQWDQPSKQITITREGTTIVLTLDSPNVSVNQTLVTLDVPARLFYGGMTYVPLRFVSQTLGAEVGWDQQARQATITTGERQLVVSMDRNVEVPSSRRITDQRAQMLVDKLNEATDISAMKQIRTYFSPYFTDPFINTLVQSKGLENDFKFKTIYPSGVTYKDDRTATLVQSSGMNSNNETLYRYATLVYADKDKGWKVSSVSFKRVDEIVNP
ncbi:copper amine oxidase N-terminal domain-containing protein [Cohnella hashimotonis]|uniref:Copper amine oxidase N-terminal domain-containing protein n=1 Tax=Cohnella hashimotonis TaxID=2826895 RepID=A0ABT6TS93_9BACL|nr:copper amine oxidase N-terminal domain-containing protein [Cohnella hashimotonis]MDI4649717.1 copper amine oxidase N-terminal domain-containing protein [Cohnella hashimotonis]